MKLVWCIWCSLTIIMQEESQCNQMWQPDNIIGYQKKHQALFGLRKNKQQPSVKRTQFPLTMSWAWTVHKVQGLSLAEGVVSFDLEKQKSFNQRQIYVALSRISSMNKMYLIGSYNKAALKVNESAKKEYVFFP